MEFDNITAKLVKQQLFPWHQTYERPHYPGT